MVRCIEFKCRNMRRRGWVSHMLGSSRESWCTVCRSKCSSDGLDLLLACLHNPAVSRDPVAYTLKRKNHLPYSQDTSPAIPAPTLFPALCVGIMVNSWNVSLGCVMGQRGGGLTWRTSSWRRNDCHGIPSGGWRGGGGGMREPSIRMRINLAVHKKMQEDPKRKFKAQIGEKRKKPAQSSGAQISVIGGSQAGTKPSWTFATT